MTAFQIPDTAQVIGQRLSLNANDPDALVALAALTVLSGRVDEGLTILDHVLQLEPDYPGGWRFKAILHRMQGEPDAERSAIEKADASGM